MRLEDILKRLQEIQAVHSQGILWIDSTQDWRAADPEVRAIQVALKMGVLIHDVDKAVREDSR